MTIMASATAKARAARRGAGKMRMKALLPFRIGRHCDH
jgi:hypothetical protein